jgi:hypothetical protein
MKKLRAFLQKLGGKHAKPASSPKEDPAEALSDERVLGRGRRT